MLRAVIELKMLDDELMGIAAGVCGLPYIWDRPLSQGTDNEICFTTLFEKLRSFLQPSGAMALYTQGNGFSCKAKFDCRTG